MFDEYRLEVCILSASSCGGHESNTDIEGDGGHDIFQSGPSTGGKSEDCSTMLFKVAKPQTLDMVDKPGA